MIKESLRVFILAAGASLLAVGSAEAASLTFTVDARANSSRGGSGLATGILYDIGDKIDISVDPNDLWSAGPLPRWSNADGLDGNLFATGSDESGEAAGTQIGTNFGLLSLNGLSAPFGSLVGEIDGTFFEIGTNFQGVASSAGELNLYYWDSNNRDNTGEISVDVHVPEPGTILGTIAVAAFSMTLKRKQKRG